MAEADPVHLLWTGGWDSTFRLLDLVLVHGRRVQPVYYADAIRASTPVERRTMDRIRHAVAQRSAAARALIADTIEIATDRLPPGAAYDAQLADLRRTGGHLGGQYRNLARLAELGGFTALELAVHRDDKLHGFLLGNVEEADGAVRLVADPSPSAMAMFRRFAFPLLPLTKVDMAARAQALGFADVMELTWFCHDPDRKGRPCGRCNPCVYTINEGLGRRIPWQNRLRHRLRRLVGPLTGVLRRYRVRHRLRRVLGRGR